MNDQSEILKSRLIQLLQLFVEKSNKQNSEALESLADSLLQIIYEGKGNDIGIIQFDVAKGLEPFIRSIIDDLTREKTSPVTLTIDHFRRVQQLLLEFNVRSSNEQNSLFNMIESLEKMLEKDKVNLHQLSMLMQKLEGRLSEFPNSEASERVFERLLNKAGATSRNKDTVDIQTIMKEMTQQLSRMDESKGFEELADYLKSKHPNLFGPSETDLKKKYDDSAKAAISKALKDNGFN